MLLRTEFIETIMSHVNDLRIHLFRLVQIARSVHTKRALTEVDPEPALNFWRLYHASQLDVAILEWCKIFGSDAEPTHWKRLLPSAEHDAFRGGLLAALEVNAQVWATYWQDLTAYRNNLVAHHFELPDVTHYPDLTLALKSSIFYYRRLISELRGFGEAKYPDDLGEYGARFEKQTIEIARSAIEATRAMPERVY